MKCTPPPVFVPPGPRHPCSQLTTGVGEPSMDKMARQSGVYTHDGMLLRRRGDCDTWGTLRGVSEATQSRREGRSKIPLPRGARSGQIHGDRTNGVGGGRKGESVCGAQGFSPGRRRGFWRRPRSRGSARPRSRILKIGEDGQSFQHLTTVFQIRNGKQTKETPKDLPKVFCFVWFCLWGRGGR